MPTIAEFRAQYPMYSGIPDADLVSRLAERGINLDVPPEQPGILSRLGTTIQRGADQYGQDLYRTVERGARGAGFDGVADFARRQQDVRAEGLRQSQGLGLPDAPGVDELWEDPSRLFSAQTGLGVLGMLANSAVQMPTFFSPPGILGQVGQFAGSGLQEQMEAQGVPLEDTSLATALPAAVAQTFLGRVLGPEALLGRRAAGEAVSGSLLRRAARQGAIGAAGEAFEEGAQEAIQIAQGDLPNIMGRAADPANQLRVANSAFYGGITGGILSGGIAAVSPGREAPPTETPMTREEAIGILQRATPMAPTVSVQPEPNATPVVTSTPPDLEAAQVSADPIEREIAMSAVPMDQRINVLNLYRQARDARAANLRAGVEVPPGGAVSPGDPRTPAPPAGPVPQLVAPPEAREAARSPVDDLVAGMAPDGGVAPAAAPPAQAMPATAVPPQGAPLEAAPAAPPTTTAQEAAQAQPAAATQPQPPQAQAPNAPTPEEVQRAEQVISDTMARIGARGVQGRRAADAALRALNDGRQRTGADPNSFRYAAPQIAAAFEMVDVISEIAPERLGQAVEFVDAVVSQRTGQPIQGTQERAPALTEDGMMGLIRLSMDPTYAGFARETAAHEGMHAIWDWFRKTDPKVFRALQAAYPTEADGSVRLDRIDNSILRLLKRNVRPDGQTYYDYLAAQDYGRGAGVYLNQDEANAVTFGAIYDLTKQGKPANSLKPLLLRAFNFFSNAMDRLRSSGNRRLLEDVATGRFRQREGSRQTDITSQGLSDARPNAGPDANPGVVNPAGRQPDGGGAVPRVGDPQPAEAGSVPGPGAVRGSERRFQAPDQPSRSPPVGRTASGELVYSAQDPSSRAAKPLDGMLSRVRVQTPAWMGLPGVVGDGAVFQFGPYLPARQAAERYMADAGLTYNPPTNYVKVDPERAARVGQAYEDAVSDPFNPLVRAAYEAMVVETTAQWEAIKRQGLQAEFYPQDGSDPYGSPRNAILDVTMNNHMFVFSTDEGYGTAPDGSPVLPTEQEIAENPLLRDTGERWNGRIVRVNDLFRAVHDYFGHIKDGVGFRADGEENAWRSHAAMYTPLARMAMTSETRGQNSWLNYGPHGATNRTAATADTVFAPQKITVMPPWSLVEGAEDFLAPLPDELASRYQREVAPRESAREPFAIRPSTDPELAGMTTEQMGKVRVLDVMYAMPEELLDARSKANRFVRATLDNPQTRRPVVPLGEMLTGIETNLPPAYKAVVDAIRSSVSPAMPVYGPGHQNSFYKALDPAVTFPEATARGRNWYVYRPDRPSGGLINIDFDEAEKFGISPAHIVLHEALHAATNTSLINLSRTAATKGGARARALLDALDILRSDVEVKAKEDGMWSERLGAGSLSYTVNSEETPEQKHYVGPGTIPRSEFIAEAFTSPQFQAYLSTVPITPEVQAALEAAGVQTQPRTMLQGLVDWLRSILNLNQNTALDAVFSLAPSLFNGPLAIDTSSDTETVRESGRQLPPDVAAAHDRLVKNEAAGWMGRKLANKPWTAGMRAQLATRLRTDLVDKYAVIEDDERALPGGGGNRLMADTSGYVALWQAEDVDRFMDAELRYNGRVEFIQDPNDPKVSHFRVKENANDGMGWLTNFIASAKTGEEASRMMDAFQVYAIAKRGTNLRMDGILTQVGAAERAAGASALRAFPEIAAAYNGYQRSNRKLMETMIQTGVLSQADADAFLKNNDYYPFYRAIPSTAGNDLKRIAGIGSKFKPKEIVGGDKQFMDDPITVILNNRAYWLNAAMRNVAKGKVVDTGRRLGNMRAFDPKKDDDGGKINLRVGGKNYVFFTDDPMTASAIESYVGLPEDVQRFVSVFGGPARMLREFITKNPTFMLYSNLIRDSLSGWQASGANITPIYATYKGIIDYYKDDADTRKYIELGHAGSRRFEDSAFRSAGDLLADNIRIEKGVYRTETGGMLLDVLKKAYTKLDNLSEASDLATRIAIFKAELERTGNETEAAWRAREIMNFSKHGKAQWLRMLAALIPFTNARIQGMDVMYQSLYGGRVGDPVKKRNEKLGKAWFRGGLMMGVALTIAATFEDDDEIKQVPRWLRDSNVLIPLRAIGLGDDGLLAIPKPFEYGTLFMTIPENLMRVMRGTDTVKAAAGGAGTSVMASLAYNPIPTAILPFFEQIANYSMFTGRPIVGQGLARMAVPDQRTRNTPQIYVDASDAAARFFNSMGMETPGFLAPVRIDHFVRAWTGSVGTYFATAIGTLAGSEDMRGWSIDRAPIVASMIRTQGNTPPGGTDDLYRMIQASDSVTQTLRRYASIGDEAMVRRVREANATLIAAKPELTRMQTRQRRISQQQREVMRDARMPEEAKRERLAVLDREMRELVRGVEALRLRAGQ